jgi:hypothetical protein
MQNRSTQRPQTAPATRAPHTDTLRPTAPPPQRTTGGIRRDDERRDTHRPTEQQAASNALAANH